MTADETLVTTTEATVREALAPHASKLRDGAADQLVKLWSDDFAGVNPGIVRDLVTQRLNGVQFSHFLAPVRTGGVLSVEDQIAANTAQRGVGNLLAGHVRHPAR